MTPNYPLSVAECQLPTILVTGGCGFIGANLVRHLSGKGYKIKVLDNLSTGEKENLPTADSQLLATDLVIGDIRDQDIVSQAVEGADAVVHLAAHTSVTESLDNPKEDWDINVNGTLKLLEACRLKGIKAFIFASSNAVLGEQPPPVDEMNMPKPLSPYGASKLAGEALCSAYHHAFGLNTVCLRFANCYGPYSEHKTSVITRFINWTRQDKAFTIYGDGEQTRDFIHVDDVCQAIYLCLATTDQISGEVFQIASGVETSINELANIIKEIVGVSVQILYKPKRSGEIERNYSDITKAKRVLGFEPKIKLRQGLRELYQSYGTKTR
jgi:UDP-glucose 4-epimerase